LRRVVLHKDLYINCTAQCAPLRWNVTKALRLAAINSNCLASDASRFGLLDVLQDMLITWTTSLGVVAVGEVAMAVAGIAGALDGEALSSGIVSVETGILNAIVTVIISVATNLTAPLSKNGLESLANAYWPLLRYSNGLFPGITCYKPSFFRVFCLSSITKVQY